MSQSLADQIKPQILPFFFSTHHGEKIRDEVASGKKVALINLDAFMLMDSQLTNIIINDAVKGGVEAVEKALKEAAMQFAGQAINLDDLDIGFYGDCVSLVKIRDIASEHIGKIIKVRGLVSRISSIRPFYTQVVFRCKECGELFPTPIPQDDPFNLTKPLGKCNCKNTQFDPAFEYSKFVDSQEFSLHERHEDISSSAIPNRLPMVAFKKFLMNMVNCGDLLEVTGIVKLKNVTRGRAQSRFNDPYLEVCHIHKESKDPEQVEISKEDIEKIKEISNNEDVFDFLVSNLASSLYGLKRAKEACLLSLLGGIEKKKHDITIRGNINTLLLGDPSTGKSQLLRTVTDLAISGMYCTGKGTSAAGLTAAMNKDVSTGEWVIDAGVLVLADKGVACIDEMDKMNNDDRVNIHEAMEQQTVSISKAGIHATLNARTAVIAAANPILGKYDDTKSIQDNIPKFPSTLLNRFDLIFILTDKPDEKRDLEIIRHVSPFYNIREQSIDRELFRKYIAYAKRIIPIWTEETNSLIEDYFLKLRRGIFTQGKEEKIPIAPRQAEALYRIAEAHARASLRNEINEDDVEFTKNIFSDFLEGVNFDVTGLGTGVSRTARDIQGMLFNLVNELHEFTKNDLMNAAESRKVSRKDFEKCWKKLLDNNVIYCGGTKGLEELYRKV